MTTFGYTTIGSSTESGHHSGIIISGLYASTQSGTLDSITVYIKGDSAAGYVTCALYDDTTLIGVTTQQSISTSPTWVTCPFASPPSVYIQNYRLAVFTSVASTMYYDAGGNYKYRLSTYPTFPDPTTWSPAGGYNVNWSLYATYTASSSGQQLFCLINCMGY